VPADLVHHFLLAICTRPGTGLCFKDNGWYPREDESGGGPKIFNKILANVAKSLKVNEDPRQQELALRILGACPELVAGYIPSHYLLFSFADILKDTGQPHHLLSNRVFPQSGSRITLSFPRSLPYPYQSHHSLSPTRRLINHPLHRCTILPKISSRP
jgi:hypothetical protein